MAGHADAWPCSGPDPIQALAPWFHNLHLPDGRQTLPDNPYGDFPAFKWRQIAPHVPQDMRGWRVLDIGCNAGFYSFELARRGAQVTAIDIDPHYLRQARWAAAELGLQAQVEFRQMQIYDLRNQDAQYDLVWLMGVLYHLRHPLLALDIVRRVTRRLLVLQTMTKPGEAVYPVPADLEMVQRDMLNAPGWPTMAFIEHRLANDPTNWWAPNHACVQALLRSAGFDVQARISHETYLCQAREQHPDEAARIAGELRAAAGLA